MIAPELFEPFRATLLAGDYNLLLGSGISLDSQNGAGHLLRSAEQLRKDLCANGRARYHYPRLMRSWA